MTVHAAKGLEFPVVAVADLGRDLLAGGRRPPVQVADPDDSRDGEGGGPPAPRVGIRLARFGTTAIGVFGYGEMLDAAAEDEAAEACRLAYVAATRARRLLILSGRYSANRLAQPEGAGPGRHPDHRAADSLARDWRWRRHRDLPPAPPAAPRPPCGIPGR